MSCLQVARSSVAGRSPKQRKGGSQPEGALIKQLQSTPTRKRFYSEPKYRLTGPNLQKGIPRKTKGSPGMSSSMNSRNQRSIQHFFAKTRPRIPERLLNTSTARAG